MRLTKTSTRMLVGTIQYNILAFFMCQAHYYDSLHQTPAMTCNQIVCTSSFISSSSYQKKAHAFMLSKIQATLH